MNLRGGGITTNLTKVEVGQRLSGLKFDTSITPDLSKFTMNEDGQMSPFETREDGGMSFMIVDLSYMVLGYTGRCIALMINRTTAIVYSEMAFDLNGESIPQGWNSKYINNEGIVYYGEGTDTVEVEKIVDGDSWNGIWAGAVLAE